MQICQFVYHQLNSNKVDAASKARYIIWLNMANEISGSKLCWQQAKIDPKFLCKTFSKNPQVLLQLAQDDAQLYQEMVFPESFFDSAIKLSDKDHAFLLAKHTILLTGQRSAKFVKQIEQFNPSIKLLFMVTFIGRGNDLETLNLLCKDLFDKKLIQWVNESVQKRDRQVTEVLTQLITDAPISALQLMRQNCDDAFGICYERISNYTVENVVQFVGNMVDNKICQRLGLVFLNTLLEKLSRWLEFGDLDECTRVLTCATYLGQLLAKDPNAYDNHESIAVLTKINEIVRLAQRKLMDESNINVPISSDESLVIISESIVTAPEKVEKDDDSSTTDEEELEKLYYENPIYLR